MIILWYSKSFSRNLPPEISLGREGIDAIAQVAIALGVLPLPIR